MEYTWNNPVGPQHLPLGRFAPRRSGGGPSRTGRTFFSRGPHRAPVFPRRGAEAILTRTEFLGRAAVEKARVPKAYRHPTIDDALRRTRIVAEARLMAEARSAGVAVPVLYDIDLAGNRIVMEVVEGIPSRNAA